MPVFVCLVCSPSKPTIVPARSPADLGLVSQRPSWVDDYHTEQRFVPNVLQVRHYTPHHTPHNLMTDARITR